MSCNCLPYQRQPDSRQGSADLSGRQCRNADRQETVRVGRFVVMMMVVWCAGGVVPS